MTADDTHVPGEGFSIIDMTAEPDYIGKIKLSNNAWSNGALAEEASEFDILKYEYSRENPCYNPRFDLSVIDRTGRHLSSCAAFIDYKNNCAIIEKVCTHTDFRKRGLAGAVIKECLRRLSAEGIEYAYLGGYSQAAKSLYGSLGAFKSLSYVNYSLE